MPITIASMYSMSPGWPGISGRKAGRWMSSVSTSSAPTSIPTLLPTPPTMMTANTTNVSPGSHAVGLNEPPNWMMSPPPMPA